jgi:uncharacterized protein YndB with AHSA1/START domain
MRQQMRQSGEVSVRIDAPPKRLYALVADVTRMGEWSPECRSCEWIDGVAEAKVGSRFRGHNRWGLNRWSRICEVIVADPDHEFAFRTIPAWFSSDSTVWRYGFSANGSGSLVTESYELTLMPPWWIILLDRISMPHHFDMRPHMEKTLLRLKAAGEEGSDR